MLKISSADLIWHAEKVRLKRVCNAFVAQTQREDCHKLHNKLTVLTCAECVVIYFGPEGADADVANAPSALDLGQCLINL